MTTVSWDDREARLGHETQPAKSRVWKVEKALKPVILGKLKSYGLGIRSTTKMMLSDDWHRATMDSWRQRRGGNALCSVEPNLVHLVERHHHRVLLSHCGSPTDPRPAISHHGRKTFFHDGEARPQIQMRASFCHALGYRQTQRRLRRPLRHRQEIITDPYSAPAILLVRSALLANESVYLEAAPVHVVWPHLQVVIELTTVMCSKLRVEKNPEAAEGRNMAGTRRPQSNSLEFRVLRLAEVRLDPIC